MHQVACVDVDYVTVGLAGTKGPLGLKIGIWAIHVNVSVLHVLPSGVDG